MPQRPRRRKDADPFEGYNGFAGCLIGSAATAVGVFALASSGFDFPPGLADLFQRPLTLVPLVQLTFALIAAVPLAMSAALLVIWTSRRSGAAHASAFTLGEVAAAIVTIGFYVALGLAGDSWGWLAAAAIVIGFAVLFLVDAATGRLRRASPLDK